MCATIHLVSADDCLTLRPLPSAAGISSVLSGGLACVVGAGLVVLRVPGARALRQGRGDRGEGLVGH